jgi:NAD(P)-dependent dehydrogenase (short-subunit alcohol dehydrogenase family)
MSTRWIRTALSLIANSPRSVEIDLQGKAIAITGAAQGLGEKMAELMATHGAKLALVNVDHEELKGTVRMCATATVGGTRRHRARCAPHPIRWSGSRNRWRIAAVTASVAG